MQFAYVFSALLFYIGTKMSQDTWTWQFSQIRLCGSRKT